MLQSARMSECEPVLKGRSCTICRELPTFLPLYKCNMGGHIICNTCFTKLPKSGGARCGKCNSVFLKMSHSSEEANRKKKITVEELFRLPKDQVNLLLNKGSREMGNERSLGDNLEVANPSINNPHPGKSIPLFKPFKCPHVPCGKTVNSSSLKTHFIYEHAEIKTYLIKRGEALSIDSNVCIIEYGMTYCIGMIEMYDEYTVVSRAVDGEYKKLNQKVPVAIFWILVSGSAERDNSKAYALYWLVTESELLFKCTLELSSPTESTSCAILCSVNDIRDDLSILAIANRMNCLYLTYGSIRNLKGNWGEVNLCVTIH